MVSAERPVSPELDNLRTMDRADMDYLRDRFVDCAVRCQKAGFRMIMLHCAHNNFLAQWLSPDSNVRTDEYGGTPENRRRYPLEVLKAVREAVGPNMVIELRVSATEDTPGGLELPESLDFMEAAQEYVDIMHVSRGQRVHPGRHLHHPHLFQGPPAQRGLCRRGQEAPAHPRVRGGQHHHPGGGGGDHRLRQGGHRGHGQEPHGRRRPGGEVPGRPTPDQVRPCTRCDLCGNANTYGTSMRCAINPRLGQTGPIEPAPVKKKVMVIGGGPGGMMAAQTLVARGHEVTLYEKQDKLGGLLN